jgi:hypothetical protein
LRLLARPNLLAFVPVVERDSDFGPPRRQ